MKWYEVYKGCNDYWDIYEVTEGGQCYRLYKRFKTEKGARNWAKKQWYMVRWK